MRPVTHTRGFDRMRTISSPNAPAPPAAPEEESPPPIELRGAEGSLASPSPPPPPALLLVRGWFTAAKESIALRQGIDPKMAESNEDLPAPLRPTTTHSSRL